ncbi:hypothetical protein KQI79_18715 [Paenibacillus sp. MSJ-34]|nr:hypothetical protein [Paenibacillus sp. MSJ-34]
MADMFQPFHRIETSRNRNTGGSGLGLYIVKPNAGQAWRPVFHRQHGSGRAVHDSISERRFLEDGNFSFSFTQLQHYARM